MRLVCPSCDAKYEVPDDAIPDTGRDVQCANCGHAWFQTRSRAVSATTPLVAEPVASPAPAPVVAEPEVTPAAPAKAAPAPVAEKSAAKAAKIEDAAPAAPEPVPEPDVPTPPAEALAEVVDPVASQPEPEEELASEAPAPAVDEKVLSILREEAEREAKARRDEGRPLESQPDLGIDGAAAPRKKAAAKKREPELEPETTAKPAARRDLLPDVEEINSTLRPSEEPESEFVGGMPDSDPREGRGAFRAGFLLVISFSILGAAVYIAAPWLAAQVPALAGLIATYVSLIDALRLGLDGLMQSATQLISGDKG